MTREGQDLRKPEWPQRAACRLQLPEQSQEPEVSSPRHTKHRQGPGYESPSILLLGGTVGLGSLSICPAASLSLSYFGHTPAPLKDRKKVLPQPRLLPMLC